MNTMNRSGLAPAWLATLVIAAVVTACGGGPAPSASDQAQNETPAAPSQGTKKATPEVTPTPTPVPPDPTPTPKRPVAGNIDFITTDDGLIEDVLANDGDKIRERQTVRTNDGGSLTFSLVDGIKLCNMYENAQVKVKPSSGVALAFKAGDFSCEGQAASGPVKVRAGPDMELELSDPQFIVSIGDQGTIIRVVRGLVDVRSIAGGDNVVLGPMESTDTSSGADVLAPTRIWQPAELEDQRLLTDLPDFKNGLDMSMPEVGGSTVLDRMAESGSINVGVPEGLTEESLNFVNGFLAGQSSDWSLEAGPTQQVVGEQDVASALEAGTIDMFISPADLPGLGQIPLFMDPAGQQFWLYYDPRQAAFGVAQKEYITNVVADESYRQVYRSKLGTEPAYEGVDELFGLE